MTDPKRELLRHAVATIAYRGGKVVRGLTQEQAEIRACEGGRSPLEILAHIGDVLTWMISLVMGDEEWISTDPTTWDAEVEEFFALLAQLDERLAVDAPIAVREEQLLQGPTADVLTHIGQIAMLRRVAGSPVRSENYFIADVRVGSVGPEQVAPSFEF
jgi:hypothetical protein